MVVQADRASPRGDASPQGARDAAPLGDDERYVPRSEDEARRRHGDVIVGRARYDEIARGLIAGISHGLLKIVADPDGVRPLGFHVLGEGATEIIHLGQMALLSSWEIDQFVDNIFNFPTLAEAYRVAALDVVEQREERRRPLPRASVG